RPRLADRPSRRVSESLLSLRGRRGTGPNGNGSCRQGGSERTGLPTCVVITGRRVVCRRARRVEGVTRATCRQTLDVTRLLERAATVAGSHGPRTHASTHHSRGSGAVPSTTLQSAEFGLSLPGDRIS